MDEEKLRQELTVENLEKEMTDHSLDIIFRERAAIGRYLLIKGIDFLIVKNVVLGMHWNAIHPWCDENGNFVLEKMIKDI